MNDNAKKWIETLESDKYKQTQRALCRGDSYCCLGVACEIFIESGNSLAKVKPLGDNSLASYDDNLGVCPEAVKSWLGLVDKYGTSTKKGASLVCLNDNGRTFKEIAKILREKEDEYFVNSNP